MIKRPSGLIQTSVLVSEEFFNLCKEHNIKFTEALRVGISILLAEKGIGDYDNKLNLFRKMSLFQQKAEESIQQVEELNKKLLERDSQGIEKITKNDDK